MHVKENTALTSPADMEVKDKMAESSISTTSAMSQSNTITATSSVTSIAADLDQTDSVSDSVAVVTDCVSSSSSVTDSLSVSQSLTDSVSVVPDAEEVASPVLSESECVSVSQSSVQNKVGSMGLDQNDSSVASTDIGSPVVSTEIRSAVASSGIRSPYVFARMLLDGLMKTGFPQSVSSVQSVAEVRDLPASGAGSSRSAEATAAMVRLVGGCVDAADGSDSAVETDDSYQEEMVIDTKDIKQEVESEGENRKGVVDSECEEDIKQEVDSEGEDMVDGHTVLRGLQDINLKAELDSSSTSSSCSLSNLKAINSWESDACMRKRLMNSLSQSFPESALSRVLHSVDTMPLDSEDEELVPSTDRLTSSCYGAIRVEKEIDEDLTSLEWLQDSDLLKNINPDLDTINEEQKENAEGPKNGDNGTGNFVPQAHPCHVPYNPQKHVNSKPPYSFSCLIFMAIEAAPGKKLPVKDIYNWILTNFPYYQNAPTGWKNSVRHNLSLNKCFKKVEKDKGANIGKGSLWCIDPEYRPNLLQALRKTPYHPYQQLQMMSSMVPQQHVQHVQGLPSAFRAMPLSQRPVPNTVSPRLFPFLSRRLAQTNRERHEFDAANTLLSMGSTHTEEENEFANFLVSLGNSHTEEEIEFANTLVSVGNTHSSGMSSDASDASGPTSPRGVKRKIMGPPKRQGPFILTPNPSTEHNYSSPRILEEDAVSGTSSIDNEYDFGDNDDISEPSDYPSDWDDTTGDEVDGDIPQQVPRKRLKVTEEDKAALDPVHGAQILFAIYRGQVSARSDNEGNKNKSPVRSSPPCAKARSPSSKLHQSASTSPLAKKRSKTAASKSSSSLSSSQSSSSSSRSSVTKPKAKPVSRTALKTKLLSKKTAKSAAAASSSSASTKSSGSVSVKSPASSKTVTTPVSKSPPQESSSSSSKKSDSATTPPSAKPASTPESSAKSSSAASSSSASKSSIIMTRRGKAAAEKAAAKLAASASASASASTTLTGAEIAAAKPAASASASAPASSTVTGASASAPASSTVTGAEKAAANSATSASAPASTTVTAVHSMCTRRKKLNFSSKSFKL